MQVAARSAARGRTPRAEREGTRSSRGRISNPQCLGGRYDGAVGAVGVRVAMAFVRGEDGCGHTPGEVSKLDDIVAGTRVPAAGLHALVYR